MARSTGFTLIELLVVIAIIAILAAILFPVFITAKAKGQQAACMANMKQIGTAIYTYLDDNNDTFPPNRIRDPLMPDVKLNGTRFNWKTATQAYTRTKTDLWRCPKNRNSHAYDETGTYPGLPPTAQRFPISYVYNGDYFNTPIITGPTETPKFPPETETPEARKLSDIARTTKLIVVIESVMNTPDMHLDNLMESKASYTNEKTGQPVKGCRMVIHQGRSNFIFADTHARAMEVRATLVPTNMYFVGKHPIYNQGWYDKIAEELANEAR